VAASLIPLSPDALLVVMVTNKTNIALSIVVATIGSYLGACFNYSLGLGIQKIKFFNRFKPSTQKLEITIQRYKKYGQVSLFFSWIPFIGDPLTFVAGYFKLGFLEFSIWVLLGRLFRFLLVAFTTLQVIE